MNERLPQDSTTPTPSGEGRNALFLVGFMGAGKTSVGRELADRLRWKFIDLDDCIVARAHRTIPEIFAEDGEPAFRRLETQALHETLAQLREGVGAVVALGGGAYVQAANAAVIQRTGLPVIFLDAPLSELRQRCATAGATRPLFQDEDAFTRLYESRREHYNEADFRVDTTGKPISTVADEILRLVGVSH